jgi:signal transduction histidine kinase/DNA-binding response OmpR family regulator
MAEEKILVVDDETGIVALCERLLRKAGFVVHAFSNPTQALEFLEQEPVHLLLVDIRMPGMDGFEVLTKARERQPDLAVVVMTGYGTVETAIETLRRGADGLILKPFESGTELVEGVEFALAENRRKRDAHRVQTLRPLFDVTRQLFSETEPSRLQNLLLEAVTGHLQCQHAALYQVNSQEPILRLVRSRGNPPDESQANRQDGPLIEAVRSGSPACILGDGPGNLQNRTLLRESGYGSLVCAPVKHKDEHRLLVAARDLGENPLSEADLEMLVVLAHQAAVALENARLYSELRSYVRQVEESQRMLIQAEKMATAGRLTASIAHEINNPLQSVQNCLHLASRAELTEDARHEYMTLAKEELDRLMSTVQRMLDFYRPGAVGRKLVDINQLIERVLLLLGRELETKKVRVHTQLSQQLSQPMVVRDQIQQVLINLILNASEAMPEGGDVYIETRQRRTGIEIVVEDTGTGVQPGDREKIFEPFVSTKESGTGLGLTVSYGIITAHGGSLELVPGRQKGACFRILLPAGSPSIEQV